MSEQVIPEAFFDSLSIAYKLDNYLDGFRLPEIHLFSYFASILYGYRGNNLADWGYKYLVDLSGYPFSRELNEAASRHMQNGLFEDRVDYVVVSGRGTSEYLKFKSLESLNTREVYLDAACTTNILVPYSQTLRALVTSPDLQRPAEVDDWLDQSGIYEKIIEISKAVGVSSDDLIIPAVSWIKYLISEEASDDNSRAS
jgi:hypothetical protein